MCGAAITRQSVDQIVQNVLALPEGERVMVLAPIVRGRKGEFKKELEKLAKEGFIRARVDGELLSLDEEIRLDKRRNHTIEAVVDRLLIKTGIRERLTDSIRTALKLTGGAVLISIVDGEEKLYSERMACVNCGINVPPLEPRSFSFNSAYGACKRCHGLGTVMEIDSLKLIPDASQTPEKLGYMGTADKQGSAYLRSALLAVCKHFNADPKNAICRLAEGSARRISKWRQYQAHFHPGTLHVPERMEWRTHVAARSIKRSAFRKDTTRARRTGVTDGLQRVQRTAPAFRFSCRCRSADVGLPNTRRCRSRMRLMRSSRSR